MLLLLLLSLLLLLFSCLAASCSLRGKPIEIFKALVARLKKSAASVEKFEKEEKMQKQKRREADERSKKLQVQCSHDPALAYEIHIYIYFAHTMRSINQLADCGCLEIR